MVHAIAGAAIGAALVAVILVVAERLLFPGVHEAAKHEFLGELGWPCCVLLVGVPIGALVGGAIGVDTGRIPALRKVIVDLDKFRMKDKGTLAGTTADAHHTRLCMRPGGS